MKRLFDVVISFFLLITLSPLLVIAALLVKADSKGSVIYWSDRIGRQNLVFKMPKFRTMLVGTPAVATHLLSNSSRHLTMVGAYLRKSSLDELPQLWSILVGDMSFVGPRPALFNQDDLIALRTQYGVDNLVPGLTGWVQYEVEYLQKQSFWFDLKILGLTFLKVVRRAGVSH